jgi:hypothetical protein
MRSWFFFELNKPTSRQQVWGIPWLSNFPRELALLEYRRFPVGLETLICISMDIYIDTYFA